jgi:hypothetical protein
VDAGDSFGTKCADEAETDGGGDEVKDRTQIFMIITIHEDFDIKDKRKPLLINNKGFLL